MEMLSSYLSERLAKTKVKKAQPVRRPGSCTVQTASHHASSHLDQKASDRADHQLVIQSLLKLEVSPVFLNFFSDFLRG